MKSSNISEAELVSQLQSAIKDKESLTFLYEKESEERKKLENELNLFKERFGLLVMANDFAWWEMDVPTGKVKFSDRKAEMLGYLAGQFTHYKDFMALVHPDDYDKTMKKMINHFEGVTENYDAVYRIRTINGNYIWFHDLGKITRRDSNGMPLLVSGIVIDIADKIKFDAVLNENEIRFMSLFQEHKSIMLLIDPISEKIIDANESAVKFYKYPVTELRGMPIHKINVLNSEELDRVKNKVLRDEQNLFIFPHRIANGEVRLVEIHSSPVEFNGQKLFFSIIHDITERRNTEDALKKSEDELRKAEEIGKFGNWKLLLNDKLMTASEGASIIYGLQKNELSVETVQKMVLPQYRSLLDKALDDLINYNLPYDVEFKIIREIDGQVIDIHSVAEYEASENIVFGTIHDISERKRIEQQLILKNEELAKLNKEKDKFFSIISHDLRGPFNGFLGLTRLIAEELPSLDSAEILKMVDAMQSTAINLYKLLDNLLQWSQMEQGLIPYNPEEVQLLIFAVESLSSERQTAKSKGINVVFDIPHNINVFADEKMLRSILSNLFNNAIKFSPKGGKIIISARNETDNFVRISVHDTGIGMSEEILGKLFRLSEQVNRKGTDGELSTGLGLFICKDFIEKHGGKIWAESKEEKSSEFYFTIPKNQ